MIAVKNPLFSLGQVLATPGALEAFEKSGQTVWEFISQHAAGSWGVVSAEDCEANNQALKDGSRLLQPRFCSPTSIDVRRDRAG
jgi:hypothetical protein